MEAVAVCFSMACDGGPVDDDAAGAAGDQARDVLVGFRGELYRCLTRRGDALSCLADAVLCEDRPVP